MGVTGPAAEPQTHRTGFARAFLPVTIDVPTLTPTTAPHALLLDGSPEIPYTHFSLAMNATRRLACWVAWNIDGATRRQVRRTSMRFTLDPRLPATCQVGDDLYSGNRLDRGHIARRADLLWGEPDEAEGANADSFFFTNIAPQMDDFNQSARSGLWGRLENAVFDAVVVDMLRLSVFGGPVFRDDDPLMRGVGIPREFWKVLAYVEDGELKAKAFLLTQRLDGMRGLELDAFRVYQVGLADIEARCGLAFGDDLKRADNIGPRVGTRGTTRRPLRTRRDIDWS